MTSHTKLKPFWITVRPKYGRFSLRLDRRVPGVALTILVFTLIVLIASISYGEYDINPVEVIQTLTGTLPEDHPDYRNFNLTVFTFRLPRIITAFMVGMALATSGAIMQGITRNPLAEPSLLGISSGAGVVAVTMIVWQQTPTRDLPWVAFAGGLITAASIYLLSWRNGGSTPIRLILIGVAISAVLNAITSFMLVFGNINDVQQAYIWLTGSVYGRTWEHVSIIDKWLLLLLPVALFSARRLNMLSLGDDVARGLGMRVELNRIFLLVISVALASAAVAVAGTVGFVGLIAPHITRRLVGPAHEGMIPVTALFGGALLVLADLTGRWVIAPSEISIGIVTAIIGAPYFMYLLYRSRY
jgi:iron complex transport system permease protein